MLTFKLHRQVEGLLIVRISAVNQRDDQERINEDPIRYASLR